MLLHKLFYADWALQTRKEGQVNSLENYEKEEWGPWGTCESGLTQHWVFKPPKTWLFQENTVKISLQLIIDMTTWQSP